MKTAVAEKFGGLDILINCAGKCKFKIVDFNFENRRDLRRMYWNDIPIRFWLLDGYQLQNSVRSIAILPRFSSSVQRLYHQCQLWQRLECWGRPCRLLYEQGRTRNDDESISNGVGTTCNQSERCCSILRRHEPLQICWINRTGIGCFEKESWGEHPDAANCARDWGCQSYHFPHVWTVSIFANPHNPSLSLVLARSQVTSWELMVEKASHREDKETGMVGSTWIGNSNKRPLKVILTSKCIINLRSN